MNCEDCVYFIYDEDYDEWYCSVDMDEDDYGRLMQGHLKGCPYFRRDDEYEVVRHQM